MADLLHYLDKMEYRPTPKPKGKVLLKRRPEIGETTTAATENEQRKLMIDVVDKRNLSGFKRTVVKDFERILGVVQEKKRREGEPRPYGGPLTDEVFVEPHQEDDELKVPSTMREEKEPEQTIEITEPTRKLAEEEEEKEPEEPEVQKEQPNKLVEEDTEEPEEPNKPTEQTEQPEEPIEKQKPGRKKKAVAEGEEGPKKQTKAAIKKNKLALPDVNITGSTKINGDTVLSRVPKIPELSKLVIKAPSYYMANRKLYIQNIAKLFMKFSKELLNDKSPVSCDRQGSATDFELLIHQRIVREYLNVYTPYRGLLLYHGLGSGKTCTSIAIAEAAKTHKRVFIMTPASLKMNFFSELKKCGDSLYKKNQFWEFISTDGRPEYISILSQILSINPEYIMRNGGAWLVDIRETEPNYSDLSPEHQKSLDEQLNHMIRSKYVDINYNGLTTKKFDNLVAEFGGRHPSGNPFDHSVVLVDEAHNLVSRIVNNLGKPKSIASKLYEYLQSAQDARIVFMSGTPIINYPHEMGVLFNMLRGYIKTWKFTIPTTTGVKLNSEKILKMFHDAGFKTFDYIDYSNDTLSITRNPFGFINLESATKRPAAAAKKTAVPKTIINGGGGISEKQEDTGSETGSESDDEPAKQMKSKSNKTKKNNANTKSKSSRKTVKTHYDREEDEDNDKNTTTDSEGETIIENATYKVTNGALVLPKDVSVNLSDDIKSQIEMEIHQERNALGEDYYHSGGTTIVDNHYAGIRLDEQGNVSDTDFERRIKEILTENGIHFLPKVEMVTYKSLPDTKDEFSDIFVDMDALKVQRPDVLKKRILGLTSYFRSAQESLLPSFVLSENVYNPQYHIEYVEMSDHQFIDYATERTAEIKREPKKPKTGTEANKEALKVSGSYRTFTRAKCNFAFPSEIPRPMPPAFNPEKNIAANDFDNINDDNELDVGDLNDTEAVKPVSGEYERAINKALADLKLAQDQFLTPEGLQQCSPKFAKILANLQDEDNRGLHLVYSAFRTLEGVGVLKLVLEANGFAEFKLTRTGDTWSILESKDPADAAKPKFVLYTGTETAEEKEIIRNIYNSNWEFVPATIADKLKSINANNFYGEVIKIIMITSSGAEGINLENTRFVHIVEPYWHMVRVDQVVGRARRICSHKNLPEPLRTIKVFLYMSKFSDKQKFSGENVGIMNRDTSRLKTAQRGAKMGETAITTDESLFEIAVLKDRLTKQLLKSVKESSVDCNIYDNSKEGLVCYTYGHATSNEFGSFPTYGEDRYVREGTDVAQRTVQIDTMEIAGVKYAHNTETGELYDFAEYKNNKKPVLVGRVAYVKDKPVFVKI